MTYGFRPPTLLRGNGNPFSMFAEPAVLELLSALATERITIEEAYQACRIAVLQQEQGGYDAVFLTEMRYGLLHAAEAMQS